MKVYQTVEWRLMPEDIREKIKIEYSYMFADHTYIDWDSWDYELDSDPEVLPSDDIEEEKFVKSVDSWLVSQECDLEKPILILINW
jgi:hypothetical protein